MSDNSFLGTGWNFPPEFRKENDPTVLVDEIEDIRQSLLILMQSRPGSRVHEYAYGCALQDFAYEELTVTVQTLMRDEIERAVLNYEPRITLNDVRFDFGLEPQGVLLIELDYTVRLTNRRSNLVYPFYLREGTHINR